MYLEKLKMCFASPEEGISTYTRMIPAAFFIIVNKQVHILKYFMMEYYSM
jgi:hypothetical protein